MMRSQGKNSLAFSASVLHTFEVLARLSIAKLIDQARSDKRWPAPACPCAA